jgi:Extensin-like protein C-terminus
MGYLSAAPTETEPSAARATGSVLGLSLQPFREAVRGGQVGVAVGLALLKGVRDPNVLSNLIFHARHPDRGGRRLERGEPNFAQLSREWLDIRDRQVRPLVQRLQAGSSTAPIPAATPGGAELAETRSRKFAGRLATKEDRCAEPFPRCPDIPILLEGRQLDGVPFEYVAGPEKGPKRIQRGADGLWRVVSAVPRTIQVIPQTRDALRTFIRLMGAVRLPIKSILTMGAYNCRCMTGKSTMSPHARAEAIDITGVRWVNPPGRHGETIIHNRPDSIEGPLVRRINACLRLSFPIVLDYNYNDAHRDHFHCDMNLIAAKGRTIGPRPIGPESRSTWNFVREALGLDVRRTTYEQTLAALASSSGVSEQVLRRDTRVLNETLDRLFREVASGAR